MLTVLEEIPPGLLEAEAPDLHRILAGPTLIHLPGRRNPPLFVSVLMHGNEDTGWLAVRALLQRYRGHELPRALSLLIGNVAAARYRQRRLDGQPDYNRIWMGGQGPEAEMAQEVLRLMRERGIFAGIDIHNNTGLNPHYACVSRLDPPFLHLATLFARTVLYFIRPTGLQSMAFAELGPAVALECGKPDLPHGVEHALEFLQACLHLAQIPQRPVLPQDIDLFHTVATVKVPAHLQLRFAPQGPDPDADITFPDDLDHLNFHELPAHTPLGWIQNGSRLEVCDHRGQEVGGRYFYQAQGRILTAVPVMPAMLSVNARIVRQDCLCYLMERHPLPA